MIDMNEVGAFPSFDPSGNFTVRIGLYLPGIRAVDGFSVVVRIIHTDDRFNPAVPTTDCPLHWVDGHPLDLWSITESIVAAPAPSHYGQEGTYLYRFQLLWAAPGSGAASQILALWFTDPFARATEIGELSAFTLARDPSLFEWSDANYKTPELDDLAVYELQVAEFNDTFDGVIDRLDYLQSLGINCLELMPVTSVKLDFDWGYGPLHYFAPNARLGGGDGLKRLVNACHAVNIAVILDVVYQHVDPTFPYKLVYDALNNQAGPPHVPSPMIGGDGLFGPQSDFSKPFTQDYFATANRMWLDDYHVDGFRYDEVTDFYFSATDTAYAKLSYDTYQHSLRIPRFGRDPASYSRIIQCAEDLSNPRDVLRNTYTCSVWQNELLGKAEDMVRWNYVDANFAHLLDTGFSGYPNSKTVNNAAGAPVDMPVAPFQYLESHDHSQLVVFAGTQGDGFFPPGDRSRFYKLQPYAIALYTLEGVPMLWQGQEFADNYHLPDSGSARVGLRRDTHWEFFYDEFGSPLVRLYRRLGQLRRTCSALRSRDSYFYYLQSLQGTAVIAYHRHAAATATTPEQFLMIFLNFADSAETVTVPFPKAGTWKEMIDADLRVQTLAVPADGANKSVVVPSNYGCAFLWPS